MFEKKVLSSLESMKFFNGHLEESQIIDVLSDIKHRIFPRPFERLSSIKYGSSLVGVEIGVCAGDHAISLLEYLDIEKLYCIDPYDLYEEYEEGKLHYGKNQLNLSDTEKIAMERLDKYRDKIVWIKKISEHALDNIKEKVDFVYIDGNHDIEFVKKDIERYCDIVKSGGVIGGHDFYNGFQREHDGVISAVLNWTQSKNLDLKVEMPDWWVNL